MKTQIVVADASCLIALQNIGELEILPKLYRDILITPEVAAEFGKETPEWIAVRSPTRSKRLEEIESILDAGEAASIALALDIPGSLLIIDERKGRRVATELGLVIIGTVGVIIKAMDAGLVSSPSTIVGRLERAGFRLSENIKRDLSSGLR